MPLEQAGKADSEAKPSRNGHFLFQSLTVGNYQHIYSARQPNKLVDD